MSQLPYRPDIDGLRAMAVLLVVGFHAFPVLVPGGFVGVDVFFVISGYLISQILIQQFEQGRFSLLEFYRRRIRRIFPALIVVLFACLIAGWFELLADEYMQLGKHVAAGAGFIANLVLWQDSSYFDHEAATKPLLHLWSLGIEEQFYFIWPLLLGAIFWFAKGAKRRAILLTAFIIITLASFFLNVSSVRNDQLAAFYSPLARFWELLFGGFLAYLNLAPRSKKIALILSLAGFLLIGVAALTFTRLTLFPGWWALLPTLGATLLIAAGPQSRVNHWLLANRPMVWIGLISYPLYLWHWPLLSFLRIVVGDFPKLKLLAILVSVVLAWLTYELIEKPFRFGQYAKQKTLALFIGMILVGGLGYMVYAKKGVEGYAIRTGEAHEFAQYFANNPPDWHYFKVADILKKYRHECNYYDFNPIAPSCYEPLRDGKSKDDKLLFIWGDSTAQMLSYGLSQEKPSNWQILQVATSACLPNPTVKEDSYTDFCQRSNWRALGAIKAYKPNVVLISQENGHSIETMNRIANTLRTDGVKEVIFIGPAPHWTTVLPKLLLRRLWSDTPERTAIGVDLKHVKINAQLKNELPLLANYQYFDLMAVFCNANGCLTRIGDDKRLGITAFDYVHLTPIASVYLARKGLAAAVFNQSVPQ